jgi:hypothetical protein
VSCGVLDGGFWLAKICHFFEIYFGLRAAVDGQQQVPFGDDKQEKQKQQQQQPNGNGEANSNSRCG